MGTKIVELLFSVLELGKTKEGYLLIGVGLGVLTSMAVLKLLTGERKHLYDILNEQLNKKDEVLSKREVRIEELHKLLHKLQTERSESPKKSRS